MTRIIVWTLIALAVPMAAGFIFAPHSAGPFRKARSAAFSLKGSAQSAMNVDIDPLTDMGLMIADIAGIKPAVVGRESWAWSHKSRNAESLILQLTSRIEKEGGKDRASGELIRARRRMMSLLLQHDYGAYVQAATVLGGLIDRKDLPNVQDIPLANSAMGARTVPQPVDRALLTKEECADSLVPDCVLPKVEFSESPLDQALLYIFRKLVQKETGFVSPKEGIIGLLDEGREFKLRPQQTAEAQHQMVYNTLAGLMTPVMPPIYKTFMSGIIMGKQYGPWPWAPWLTSFVTPTFFGFLVGPSRPNRRADGKLGGLVVEKCKFLQESGCKGLCMNQCKLPAQKFFDEYLGLPLTVTPNFETQECQWSFGEVPVTPELDPRLPKGCLSGCPTREVLREVNQAKPCY